MEEGEIAQGEPSAAPKSPPVVYLSLFIPLQPPSVNALYQIIFSRRKVELKPEVRTFKTRLKQYIPPTKLDSVSLLKLTIRLYGDWYYKNGKVKKADLSNYEKVIQDALCEQIGQDDALIWEKHTRKVQSPNRVGIEICLQSLDSTPDTIS